MVALVGGAVAFEHPKDCGGFAAVEGRKGQGVLQESGCHRLRNSTAEKEGFIMGYGGALTLVNGSPFDWVTSSTHSYQMDTWKWPTINAGMIRLYTSGITITTDDQQERRQECTSSSAQSGRRKTMQERLTTISRAHRTSLPC